MSEQQPLRYKINHRIESLFSYVRKTKPICCIYLITSPSGKMYIGQTVNIFWRIYKYSKMHCYNQAKLYCSFKKYGWENHCFEVIKECTVEELDKLEVFYIELYDTFNSDNGLNLVSGGSRPKYSEETREKMRVISTGKKYSKETNYKKGSGYRGKKLPQELRNRMSAWLSNPSAETRKKMSDRVLGKNNPMYGKFWTQEQKAAHSKKVSGENGGMYGKKHSEESLIKMRISHSHRSEETKLKMSLAKTGKKLSEEHKAKISEGGKARYKKLKNVI